MRLGCLASRIRLRATASLLGVAALALLAAGCGSTGGGTGTVAASSQTLNVAFSTGITTIDPAQVCTTYDYSIVKNTYDNLVRLGPASGAGGGQIEPALATAWTLSPDKRTWTFKLRKNVTFASGNPLTAADVVFSLKRDITKQGCQEYVLTQGEAHSVESIVATSPDTVQIHLAHPNPLFLSLLAQTGEGVVDSKLLNEHGGLSSAGDQWLATHTAGSGAYVLTAYQPDSEVALQARKGYWGGAPKSSHVVIRIVTDPTSLQTLVQSGQENMAFGVPLQDVRSLATESHVYANPSQYYIYVGLNNKKPPLNDPRVRKALADAVPFQSILNSFGYGYAQQFSGPIPPAMPFYSHLPAPSTNVAEAKQLLAQAGVTHASLNLVVKSGDTLEGQIATVLQAAWLPLGIHVNIQTLGASSFSDVVDNFKSQMYIILDGPTVNDPAYFLGYLIQCGDLFNWAQYCNRHVDTLLAAGRAEFSAAKRVPIYAEISQLVNQEEPMIPIFATNDVVVASKSLQGYAYYDDQQPVFSAMSVG